MLEKLVDKIKYGATRSPEWAKVRKAHIESHPACEACGSLKKVEVHHKKPFHTNPELELEPSNLISLCEGKEFSSIVCHLMLGHLGNYKDENPLVEETVTLMKKVFEGKNAAEKIQ